MNNAVPIEYLGFWDVPRNFLVRFQGKSYLFDCPFDDDLDDYPESYSVYSFPSCRGRRSMPIGPGCQPRPFASWATFRSLPFVSIRRNEKRSASKCSTSLWRTPRPQMERPATAKKLPPSHDRRFGQS